MNQAQYSLTLQFIRELAPRVRHFAFSRTDGTSITFIPGQFVTLHLNSAEGELRRSYSISSIPGIDSTLDFAASFVEHGTASQLLFSMKPGDTVQASGPYGRLILRDEAPFRYIFIATGTGVSPYRTMLPEIEHRIQTYGTKAMFLQGVRTPEDLLYSDDFQALATRYKDHCTFLPYFSRAKNGGHMSTDLLLPFGYPGHVQDSFSTLQLNAAQDIVYLCGNPKMIDDAFVLLQEYGFEPQQIRREKYLFSR